MEKNIYILQLLFGCLNHCLSEKKLNQKHHSSISKVLQELHLGKNPPQPICAIQASHFLNSSHFADLSHSHPKGKLPLIRFSVSAEFRPETVDEKLSTLKLVPKKKLVHIHHWPVGGWTHPFMKKICASQIGNHFPKSWGNNKTSLETPN